MNASQLSLLDLPDMPGPIETVDPDDCRVQGRPHVESDTITYRPYLPGRPVETFCRWCGR